MSKTLISHESFKEACVVDFRVEIKLNLLRKTVTLNEINVLFVEQNVLYSLKITADKVRIYFLSWP